MSQKIKKHHEPLIHIVKRDDLLGWQAWGIRLAAIAVGVLLIGVISSLLTGENFFKVYDIMFSGVFGRIFEGKTSMLWKYLQDTAILLCLGLAVAPAFKMKFWNCGAEGQALVGGLAAMFCMITFGGKISEFLLVPIVIAASILAGAIWGVIPAIFKAKWNTNETLFTLMMNYMATQLIAYYVYIVGGGSNVITPVSTGALPVIGNLQYLLNVLIVAALTVAMYVFLRYSKQGYEIAVVGESQNTARYIGINVKKVFLRTMMLSGAVCGVAGMLLVAGTDHSINTNTVGGQGFTAIMVAWLGKFNPFVMALMSGLIIFLRTGAAKVADSNFLNSSFADISVGIVILLLVGCEFFVQYSVRLRRAKKEVEA
ncbi:MAG: ABC transporter permease [Clostridia bacterium]|nr:ABC transporter permease [Clostridia bacterium]MBR4087209.1 ABC transporter permease [Clostridia bacterium]